MSTFFLYFSKNFPNVCNVYYFFTSNKIRELHIAQGFQYTKNDLYEKIPFIDFTVACDSDNNGTKQN